MFSKNTYLLQQDSPSVVGLNGNEILLHHHHQDMLSTHYLASNPPVVEAAVLYNQDVSVLNGDPSTIAPKTAKKDRHSKIYTSQGPRDRRVRLSIGVARKFFDLQEMLGFDKPSKTLDWLLTKSKTAIKHLVRTKNNDCNKSVSSLSECEENERSSKAGDTKGKSVATNANNKHKGTNLAKESRVKARARARERTREKMSIKHFNESSGRNTGSGYDFPIQYMNNQLEVCKISGNNVGILHCSPYEGASNQQDLIHHEPVVIKTKAKHPSIFGFQPNYNIPSPYNATENWDISNILDQAHKFNNSSSNN